MSATTSIFELLSADPPAPTMDDVVSANIAMAKTNAELRQRIAGLDVSKAELLQLNTTLATENTRLKLAIACPPGSNVAINRGLVSALESLMELTEAPPDSNCSCHIAPPCDDCVEWSMHREVLANCKDALAAATQAPETKGEVTP